jgi:hypothetical protein
VNPCGEVNVIVLPETAVAGLNDFAAASFPVWSLIVCESMTLTTYRVAVERPTAEPAIVRA